MIELSLPPDQRMTANDLLKTMRDQIDRLYETSPDIPPIVIAAFKEQYGDLKHIARPEIANGLDPIHIFCATSSDVPEVVPEEKQRPKVVIVTR
jgi:hypothetical protein